MKILVKHSLLSKFDCRFNVKKAVVLFAASVFLMPAVVLAEDISGMANFANFANKWLNSECFWPSWCQGADINTDGRVDITDLIALPENWPLPSAPAGVTWVRINEPGFSGQMSRYETTNDQYAAYLNSALSHGLIVVHANGHIFSANDTTYSQAYNCVYPSDAGSQITYCDGVFSVRTRDGYYMGDHPVASVTFYGAMAFCDYYGYRLPTNAEWMAVADYDGTFIFGCGINGVLPNPQLANYGRSNPLSLSSEPHTTPVTYYPSYGYGLNDMTGNVYEWTTTIVSYDANGLPLYMTKGIDWVKTYTSANIASYCATNPSTKSNGLGFRVCR